MELWEVFEKLLAEKEVKISDVARATGIPYTTVDSIIKKQLKDVKFDSATKIAKYFGVPVDYLATGGSTKRTDPRDNILANLENVELLNEYGLKRLKLYLEDVLLSDKDCLKKGE